jgi:DNA-binding transcriptional LysR family regulator
VTEHPVIRFGIHGSPHLPARILRETGRTEDQVRWVYYDVADPFRELRAGDVDVMIVKFAVHEPGLEVSAPVAHDARAVVLGADHPLAGRAAVSVEDLADYEAFHCPDSFPSYVWDEMVPPHTPSGRPIRRVHQMGTVSQLVDQLATSQAVHLSVLSLAELLPPKVRVVPIEDLPPAPVALCWLRDRVLPPHVAGFVADAEQRMVLR